MAGFDLTEMEILPFDVENEEGWTFQIHVVGNNLVESSRPLVARLGDQEIEAVTIYSEGAGFSGLLREAPQEGQRLFVNYSGYEEQQTELVFHAGDV
jgi:hypothetical protein